MKASTRVWLYTDGGSRGNPGPAAIAFLIVDARGAVLVQHAECIGATTNNVEYTSLLRGLEAAQRLGATDVTTVSDSLLLVNQLNGAYKIKAAHLRALYDAVSKHKAGFARVVHEHVARSDERIAMADRLLNDALGDCTRSPHLV